MIREAYSRFRHAALLWSMGKDSTALLWMCRKAFFGTIPFTVLHIDTGYKFNEIYDFRKKYTEAWNLNLKVIKNEEAIKEGMNFRAGRFECCNALKTQALKKALAQYGFQALLLAIRRDEHGIRAKERYFSPRDTDLRWDYKNQPPELWGHYYSRLSENNHFRIHPMLDWREIDVWQYTKKEKIPTVPLYFSSQRKRYRSIGCQTCCSPVSSGAATIDQVIKELRTTSLSERFGRAQDKEDSYNMQRLRSLGYM